MNIQQKPRLQHRDERARCKSAAQMDSQQKLTHRDNGRIISGDIQREIATIKVSLALFPAWKRWKPLSATPAKSLNGQETPSHGRRKLDLRRWVRTVFQAHSEESEKEQKLVVIRCEGNGANLPLWRLASMQNQNDIFCDTCSPVFNLRLRLRLNPKLILDLNNFCYIYTQVNKWMATHSHVRTHKQTYIERATNI